MKSNGSQKPESITIMYDHQRLKNIVDALFEAPQDIKKKEKVLGHIKHLDEKINKIKEYQNQNYPEDFYSSMRAQLLDFQNLANEIHEYTKHYNLVLSNKLKNLILSSIEPLREALREPIPDEIIFKTKRLYAQQSFVCRRPDLQERLIQHLKELKRILKRSNEARPRCYISYAWPSEKRKEEEYWVQPFLYILYDHLTAAGVRVMMDIRDNEAGKSIVAFTKQYGDGNYIILIGTESLLEKHHAEGNHVIQSELNIIERRFKQDQDQFGQSGIYPLLISGTIETAYPERYRGYVTVKDLRENSYLKMLKDLMGWVYKNDLEKSPEKERNYTILWKGHFNSFSNLPNDFSDVEEEISQNYHKRQDIEDLKQNRKIQKKDERYISSSSFEVEPESELTFIHHRIEELPEETNLYGESSTRLAEDETQTTVSDTKLHGMSDPESNIMNVSGYDNCCGLFALALAVKIAMREKAACKSELPDFFESIDEEALKHRTEETEYVGKKLREEMCSALLSDEDYKERRFHSFVEYCRATLETTSLPEDMESFAEITQEYIESLKGLWLSVQEGIEKQIGKVKAEYKQYLETNKVKKKLLDEIKRILSLLVINSPGYEEVVGLIRDSFEEEPDLIYRLIKFNRLYRSAWLEIKIGTEEQRKTLVELYDEIVNEKSIALLKEKQGEEFIIALMKLSFLQKTSFGLDGQLEKICGNEEIISTAISLLVRSHLTEEWDHLYENYCEYIKENPAMLTADELGCLTNKWSVQLEIQFESREPYKTYQEHDPTLIHVTLCNSSQDHWQVLEYKKRSERNVVNVCQEELLPELSLFRHESRSVIDLPINDLDSIIKEELASYDSSKDIAERIKDLEETILFDKERVEANQTSNDESTSLMRAAENGQRSMVAQLFEKEANVNQVDKNGWTKVMHAARDGHELMVAQLLEQEVEVNQTDKDEKTSPKLIAQNEHVSIVGQLLEEGVSVHRADKNGYKSLMTAAADGNESVVAQLLEEGADVNQVDEDGKTPLMIAAQYGYEAVVAQLLKNGARVDKSDEDGETPLMIAAQYGHEAVVAQLLKNGARVNKSDEDRWTALMFAVEHGYEVVIAQLLKNGADVNTINDVESTPLCLAARDGNFKIVKTLISAGANLDKKDKDDITPLHFAVCFGHEEVVKQLVKAGANIEIQDSEGDTPLHLAAKERKVNILKLLIISGANVNAKNKNGMTALHFAAKAAHLAAAEAMVKALIAAGADIDLRDKSGFTPLYLAKRERYDFLTNLLIEKGSKTKRKGSIGIPGSCQIS